MTPVQAERLRALLARGCFLPAARDHAEVMLRVHDNRSAGCSRCRSRVTIRTDNDVHCAACGHLRASYAVGDEGI